MRSSTQWFYLASCLIVVRFAESGSHGTTIAQPPTCSSFSCPNGWFFNTKAKSVVCDVGQCNVATCCTQSPASTQTPVPTVTPKPLPMCADFSCPSGWSSKKTIISCSQGKCSTEICCTQNPCATDRPVITSTTTPLATTTTPSSQASPCGTVAPAVTTTTTMPARPCGTVAPASSTPGSFWNFFNPAKESVAPVAASASRSPWGIFAKKYDAQEPVLKKAPAASKNVVSTWAFPVFGALAMFSCTMAVVVARHSRRRGAQPHEEVSKSDDMYSDAILLFDDADLEMESGEC